MKIPKRERTHTLVNSCPYNEKRELSLMFMFLLLYTLPVTFDCVLYIQNLNFYCYLVNFILFFVSATRYGYQPTALRRMIYKIAGL